LRTSNCLAAGFSGSSERTGKAEGKARIVYTNDAVANGGDRSFVL
jgi:hypothetical protein